MMQSSHDLLRMFLTRIQDRSRYIWFTLFVLGAQLLGCSASVYVWAMHRAVAFSTNKWSFNNRRDRNHKNNCDNNQL